MANPYVKQTWTDGVSQTTAARMGVLETGIFDAHFQPCVHAYHSANQSINNITETVLAFNSEDFDQDGLGTSTMHDNATNNSRLTAKVAGKYDIGAALEFAANTTGVRYAKFRLNGATEFLIDNRSAASSFQTSLQPRTTRDLAVNDYIEVLVYQSSGGALNVEASSRGPRFWMQRIG